MKEIRDFKDLIELTKYFNTEQKAHDYLALARWGDTPVCPQCGSVKVYKLKYNYRYQCGEKECKKTFRATTGTIYESSHIPLSKWFVALYIATSHKKGISSLQLHKDISVTQKTAWFLNHRIRLMLKDKAPELFDGIVEVDETYVGGKFKNKHKSVRKATTRQEKYDHKTPVIAIVHRKSGKVYTKIVKQVDRETVEPIIKRKVKNGSTVMSDQAKMYTRLGNNFYYNHESVNHEEDEYVRGEYHTNTVEGFFGLLKRGIIGIYHYVSPKHLHRYCDEFSFRYETREQEEIERFNNSLANAEGCRLKYKDLIATPPVSEDERPFGAGQM